MPDPQEDDWPEMDEDESGQGGEETRRVPPRGLKPLHVCVKVGAFDSPRAPDDLRTELPALDCSARPVRRLIPCPSLSPRRQSTCTGRRRQG